LFSQHKTLPPLHLAHLKVKLGGAMIRRDKKESGQIIIIIAVVFVALLAMASLAIDVAMAYADRRQAQNAADSAALSGALSKCKGGSAVNTATSSATNNGFTTGSGITVQVSNPPTSGQYAGNANYVQVKITTPSKGFFNGILNRGTLVNEVTAIAACSTGTGPATTEPAVAGDLSVLALHPTASNAYTNSGAASLTVDGGVFINSNASTAMNQSGSAVTLLNWLKVRGGVALSGSVNVNSNPVNHAAPPKIDILGNLSTSGATYSMAGEVNVNGNVNVSATTNFSGGPFRVGGNMTLSGAANIQNGPFSVHGFVNNSGGAAIPSTDITVGGYYTASGNGSIGKSGTTGTLRVAGNITLSGSATMYKNVIQESASTYSCSGGGGFTDASRWPWCVDYSDPSHKYKPTAGSVTIPTATPIIPSTIPQMSDPLATILMPPALPTGSCETISTPSYGTQTLAMVTGHYYCSVSIGGSLTATIPPGKYWVNSFSVSGDASLTMNGSELYIKTGGFSASGSGKITMKGTMVYIKAGAFSASGAAKMDYWTGPTSGTYQGLILYMDRANSSAVSQSGSASLVEEKGTWYAPASACTFSGNTPTTVYAQFICSTINISGSSALKIQYDGDVVYQVPVTGSVPQVSLIQ
jgi:hypothetical protein